MDLVLKANMAFIDANSYLMLLAQRRTIRDYDAKGYAEVMAELTAARSRVEQVQKVFVQHKITVHGETAWGRGE